MKWFKHLSNARDDERIAQLEDVAGLEGYGFYFKLLEIVASCMDGTDRCEVSYSVSRWGTLTNCHPIKARTLVGKVASCGLVESRLEGDRLLVRIPNLLKFRDNHTKNLQAADKQDVDKDVDKKKKHHSAEPQSDSAPHVAHLPLVDGSEWGVTEADIVGWQRAYPATDVRHQLLLMREWLLSHPTRRKTPRGVRAFVTGWLGRQQDRGGGTTTTAEPAWKGAK